MDYREALLLRAARETGVLEAVATDAGTPREVADAADVTERAARVTLEAMVELGYLETVGDGEDAGNRYEITNRALGFLAKADVRSIGPVPHALDCVERWLALPETMRTGDPPDPPEDSTTNLMGAMASADESAVRAGVTAAVHRRPGAERVLDVGGPGSFAAEFARRGFDVTLLDRPDAIERNRRRLEREPVDLVEGDAAEELPGGFDLVFRSRVVPGRGPDAPPRSQADRALGPDGIRRFFARAGDALEPGGAVVVLDAVRGRAADAALFGAHLLAQTGTGDAYTDEQYAEWLREAGFEDLEIRDVPGTDYQVIAGLRPGN